MEMGKKQAKKIVFFNFKVEEERFRKFRQLKEKHCHYITTSALLRMLIDRWIAEKEREDHGFSDMA